MATFNGHKNWNHWNVSLWINNDESLYRLANHYSGAATTKDEAANRFIGHLQRQGVYKTPDGAPYSKSSVRAALANI